MLASVLLPFRDAAPTLGEALDSLLAEAGEFEVLAIDDGSEDGGGDVVTARRDPRLRLLRSPGSGIVAALNHGRDLAVGAFVVRMDADDVHLPGRIAASVAALEADATLGVVGTTVELLASVAAGEGLVRYVAWQNALLTPEDHAAELYVESPICHPTFALRAETLRALGGYREGPFAEDYDLLLRVDALGLGLAKVREPGLRWRHSSGRLTFRDPRYGVDTFRHLKTEHLAPRLARERRDVFFWGAGRDGRRMLRVLLARGVGVRAVVDVDPRKIGRTLHGLPIVGMESLPGPERAYVLACVGTRGARALIRDHLEAAGYADVRDFRMLA